MLNKISIMTDREGMIDITEHIREIIQNSGKQSGICVIFCAHTTAAITINENTDPFVQEDLFRGLRQAIPHLREFRHMEGNSAAHIKSSCIGVNETVIFNDGQLVLGTWQSIYLCEFDGPRQCHVFVELISE